VDKPGLWIFGCSLTYGWAINDQDTFAWLLQEKFPQYEVDNFGVSGYGTVHAYQQITEALKTRAKPKIIIIAYGSFHDTRNVCSRHYRKAIIPHADLGNLKFLWARFDREGRLVYSQEQAGYTEVPFMRYSAFIHRLEESYNRRERETLKHHEVSRAVMADVIRLCREQGITILVAGLQADDITSQMLACAKEQGAYVVDIAVDLKIKENTNLPHDGHPSPKANREYAARLAAFLQTTVFPTPSGKK
jgi:hypothetical protein